MKWIWLAAGGAAGTVIRYAIAEWIYKGSGMAFPWGTLAVNLIGSFLIGILWGLLEYHQTQLHLRLFLFVGLLGGFTTFSSFSIETINLFRTGEAAMAVSYILISNLGGIASAFAGLWLGRILESLNVI